MAKQISCPDCDGHGMAECECCGREDVWDCDLCDGAGYLYDDEE